MIMLKSTHEEILQGKNNEIEHLKSMYMDLQIKFNEVLKNEVKLKKERHYFKSKLDKFEAYLNKISSTEAR